MFCYWIFRCVFFCSLWFFFPVRSAILEPQTITVTIDWDQFVEHERELVHKGPINLIEFQYIPWKIEERYALNSIRSKNNHTYTHTSKQTKKKTRRRKNELYNLVICFPIYWTQKKLFCNIVAVAAEQGGDFYKGFSYPFNQSATPRTPEEKNNRRLVWTTTILFISLFHTPIHVHKKYIKIIESLWSVLCW